MRVFYLDKYNVCYFVEKIRDAEDFLSWVCHHPRLDPCYRTIEKYCDAQEDIAIPAWCPLEEVKTIDSIVVYGDTDCEESE